MATAACIAGGIKSYNNHVEQTVLLGDILNVN